MVYRTLKCTTTQKGNHNIVTTPIHKNVTYLSHFFCLPWIHTCTHQPLASIPSISVIATVLCCPKYSNVHTRPDPQRADWKCAATSSSVSSGVSPTIFTQYKSSGEEDIVHWLGARLELAPCELKRMRAVTVRGKKECRYLPQSNWL